MRVTALLTFVAGLAVAGGSAYLASDFFQNKYEREAAEAQRLELTNVIVAAQDIPFGQTIESQKVTSIKWPVAALPKGAFTSFDKLLPSAGQQPRRARSAFAQGELMLASKVSEYGEKVTIVQTLGANNRAVSISVSAVTGVGGFVTPGDRVDVLLTQGRGEELKTVTILQNLRVIGVDQTANESTEQAQVARTVTVEVSPADSQKLALAQQAGTLTLALRTLDSEEDEPLESIGLKDVLRELSPVPEGMPLKTITVRRGIEATEAEVR
ncbi:Flp pilus assembly protein CpaB [Sinirhodobacter sp. WL0062]|uniref:Flp pilus assembly protein CpaB n=1 Tax=Rhodobacter flavimaris TaxID=2907145 RepID=A0ABS8YQ48_9RHOB|nr:Flp pilus assembly protein CpaB [Sinirhodobacter sp. WL0062]MCE5972024.1 Flp pilus assembly protein CpaB [Sinirhodobacter sp. WL0062]